jgi:acetyl-CoA C-acetyltransferase
MREVVIAGGARTPIGAFQGQLAGVTAPALGQVAVRAALERAGVSADAVQEVLMGCVLPAGIGQAPARQAALAAGLPKSVPATTVNKVCGSGLKTVILGAQAIAAGDSDLVVAGGMESMSNAPYLLPKARTGLRLGHGEVLDTLVKDGLWDVYNDVHMGNCAEICAKEKQISREAQDAYAAESYRRALKAQADGKFKAEIAAVEIPGRKGPTSVLEDEEPKRGDIEKLAALRPAFDKAGTVTAGNASSINDGAAAVVLMSADAAAKAGQKALARVVAHGQFAQAPEWFTTAPIGAINACLDRAGWKADDVDLWEINEAFAVVALANLQGLGISADRCNIWGGAVALGHPIGASGTRILVTLLSAMQERGARRGVAALCIGGGEGIALAVERA